MVVAEIVVAGALALAIVILLVAVAIVVATLRVLAPHQLLQSILVNIIAILRIIIYTPRHFAHPLLLAPRLRARKFLNALSALCNL